MSGTINYADVHASLKFVKQIKFLITKPANASVNSSPNASKDTTGTPTNGI